MAELEALLPSLPIPTPLRVILAELRTNLKAHPRALLGEVGIDKSFKLPSSPAGYTRDPAVRGTELLKAEDSSHALGLRGRGLTSLATPLSHQLAILTAQVEVAIQLERNVSFHSVRAGGATLEWFNEMATRFPSSKAPTRSKRQVKRAERVGAVVFEEADVKKGFADISEWLMNASFSNSAHTSARSDVDLHSCSLSAQLIEQLQVSLRVFEAFFARLIPSLCRNGTEMPMSLSRREH